MQRCTSLLNPPVIKGKIGHLLRAIFSRLFIREISAVSFYYLLLSWMKVTRQKKYDSLFTYISPFLPLNRHIYLANSTLNVVLFDQNAPMEPSLFSKDFVKGGDWDESYRPLFPDYYSYGSGNAVHFRSVFQYLVDGLPLEETDEYKMRISKKSHKQGVVLKYLEPSDTKKLRNLNALIHAIKNKGYLDQKKLGARPFRCNRSGGVVAYNEKRVAINRDGIPLLLHLNANHRLAVAKIVGVHNVPVWVQGVHLDWAKRCVVKHGTHPLRAINLELNEMDLEVSKYVE